MTPAMNILPSEVLVETEYITIAIDGGIRMPSAPEVVMTPAPKRGGKPALTIAGIRIEPIATTHAGDEPESAAKSAHASTAARPRPPYQWPTRELAKLIIRLATPPWVRKLPARMKNGIAMISKLSRPVKSLSATDCSGTLVKPKMKVSTVRPRAIEIGIPVALKVVGVTVANPWIIFALLVALMLTGMPISIALGLTVLTYLFTMTSVPIESVALKLFTGIEKFEIMAIPFFILAGNFLTHGGVARRMIDFASSVVGHWHGGLGLAGVMACALFAAVSGSSPATVVAIGSIVLPAMVRQGFPNRFGAGVITTSGALGILIPPSIVMVMYSFATNTSVGALFIAGIIPGLILATMLGLTTWWRARKNNYPRQPRATWVERWRAFRKSVWGLLLIVVVIGGIYTGIFTPTEAAAMSAVYAFIVAVFVYKDMPLSRVPKVLLDSANMSAMLLYIITNAVMFSYLMTSENIPQAMAAWMLDQGLGAITFLLVVNVLLLLAGNVMEPSSIVLIMAPILFPVAMKLGIDPIHFGIMMVVNMEVGMCHPPVGLNLYVASGITKMGITELTVAVWPWLLTMLVFLVVVTYWPTLTLWFPRALGMM